MRLHFLITTFFCLLPFAAEAQSKGFVCNVGNGDSAAFTHISGNQYSFRLTKTFFENALAPAGQVYDITGTTSCKQDRTDSFLLVCAEKYLSITITGEEDHKSHKVTDAYVQFSTQYDQILTLDDQGNRVFKKGKFLNFIVGVLDADLSDIDLEGQLNFADPGQGYIHPSCKDQ